MMIESMSYYVDITKCLPDNNYSSTTLLLNKLEINEVLTQQIKTQLCFT